ncbi:MAG TPA: hypothetical protein VGJ26_01100 [Pirellulales bacterium]|jgi:hypothetical protein
MTAQYALFSCIAVEELAKSIPLRPPGQQHARRDDHDNFGHRLLTAVPGKRLTRTSLH